MYRLLFKDLIYPHFSTCSLTQTARSAGGQARVRLAYCRRVNIPAYCTSTEENCRAFGRLCVEREWWTIRHRVVFARKKSELIHLAQPENFDMAATVNVISLTLRTAPDIRILEVQMILDSNRIHT